MCIVQEANSSNGRRRSNLFELCCKKGSYNKMAGSYCEEYCHIDHEGDKMVWADAMLKQAKIQAEAKNDE